MPDSLPDAPRVFLSYSQDDAAHRQRVLALADRLRDDGVDAELDQYVEGAPAEGWPRWMLDRLDDAQRVLIVCTEEYYRRFRGHAEPGIGKGVDWEGAFVTQELYQHKSKSQKFVPVLFDPQDEPFIPEPLRSYTFHLVNTEAGYAALYDVLLSQAGVERRPLGTLRRRPRTRRASLAFAAPAQSNAPAGPRGVPDLPPHFLARPSALAAVKAAVLGGDRGRVGVGAGGATGLQGMGGVGKSVLAAAVARDPEVVAAFPDGVYWLTFGQTPDLLALQRALLEWLTGKAVRLESVPLGTVAIQHAFVCKRGLIVLDDVWQRDHADAFTQLGDASRLLVTTRDRVILTALGAIRVDVDVLEMDDALGLLARWAETPPQALPPEAAETARESGRLPLALALAGAQVRDGASWADVRDALREGDLKFLDHADRSVFSALDASVHALPTDQASRYRELAFVPEDTLVPESVVVRLWTHEGMKERDARALIRSFAGKSLLFVDGGERGPRVVRLHDCQRDYLHLVVKDPSEAHARLLNAYSVELPGARTDPLGWGSLDVGEAYLWQHLIQHLIEAGRHGVAQALVCDGRWLSAKVAATSVASLLGDLATVVKRAPSEGSRRIEKVLRLEAGWLDQDAEALPGLLYNRLCSDGLTEAEIEHLVTTLRPPVRLRHPVRFGEGRAFRGHTAEVRVCTYSFDGARVLSASSDYTVREWDRTTGTELQRFEGHTADVTASGYSQDGTCVLSASFDKTVREWDRKTGTELQRFEGHSGTVWACTYSVDGARVLSASEDHTVREWDRKTGQQLRRLDLHPADSVTFPCEFSPDGRGVLSTSDRRTTLREWDRATGHELQRFEGHTKDVSACAYSPDGSRVLSAGSDYTLLEWDRVTGRELQRFTGERSWVSACAYSPDGSRILSASGDHTIREWDRATGRELLRFEGHTDRVLACVYSSDSLRVLSASRDKTLREWDRAEGSRLQRLVGHSKRVSACAYLPDGSRVLSASADNTLREWDGATGRELRCLDGDSFWGVIRCAYSPDGLRILCAHINFVLRECDPPPFPWTPKIARECGRSVQPWDGSEGSSRRSSRPKRCACARSAIGASGRSPRTSI